MTTMAASKRRRTRHPPAPSPKPYRQWSARKFAAIWDRRKADDLLDLPAWAQAVGVRSTTTLYNWRRGLREPTATQFFALADALDVHPNDLTE